MLGVGRHHRGKRRRVDIPMGMAERKKLRIEMGSWDVVAAAPGMVPLLGNGQRLRRGNEKVDSLSIHDGNAGVFLHGWKRFLRSRGSRDRALLLLYGRKCGRGYGLALNGRGG